jgi:hypothetical protein
MRFASLFRSVCLLTLLAVPSAAFAQVDPPPPQPTRGHPAAGPLLATGAVTAFLGSVALFIGLHQGDDQPLDLSDDPIRTGLVTAGGIGFGLGVVLLAAGIPAALATPSTGQRSSALAPASPVRALVLGYRLDF